VRPEGAGPASPSRGAIRAASGASGPPARSESALPSGSGTRGSIGSPGR
jgi:hypothetical protein